MKGSDFHKHTTRTLLYYDIFDHPLTASELYHLFPINSMKRPTFIEALERLSSLGEIKKQNAYYHLNRNGCDLADIRLRKEKVAHRRQRIARFVGLIIKYFPFVRGIFISGDLSKGVAGPTSDIDYVIVTEPGRLWICRALLTLFKKIFLWNQKRYFCLNYYISSDNLFLGEHNYYTATEIAHLKPLFNFKLYLEYMNTNSWIKKYFPNFSPFAFPLQCNYRRQSNLQKVVESIFVDVLANRLDNYLMNVMKKIWLKRYPEYPRTLHESIFRCFPNESRAFIGNFSETILSIYHLRLRQNNLQTE